MKRQFKRGTQAGIGSGVSQGNYNATFKTWREQLGPNGRALAEQYAATGCTEQVDLSVASTATYKGHNINRGFRNEMLYGAEALKSVAQLFSTANHESIHAIQYMLSAACHATPMNKSAVVVLCPRDAARLFEYMERDAYAKQSMLDLAFMRKYPEKAASTPVIGFTAGIFQSMRTGQPDLSLALAKAGDVFVSKPLHGQGAITAAHRAQVEGVMTFKSAQDFTPDRKFVFAQLGHDDIITLGSALGVNSFASEGALMEPFRRAPRYVLDMQREIDRLNKHYGIGNEEALPTFAEALAAQGLTREQFLKDSRSIPFTPAPTPKAGEPSPL